MPKVLTLANWGQFSTHVGTPIRPRLHALTMGDTRLWRGGPPSVANTSSCPGCASGANSGSTSTALGKKRKVKPPASTYSCSQGCSYNGSPMKYASATCTGAQNCCRGCNKGELYAYCSDEPCPKDSLKDIPIVL